MLYLTEKSTQPGGARVLTETNMVLFERLSEPGAKLLRVRGEVGRANRPTGNGRYYSEALLRREVKNLKPMIEKRGVLGELDHPESGRSSVSRTALVVTALDLEDDGRLMATYEVLNTSLGKDLRAILEADCMVGASIRGYGTTSMREGVEQVNDDYRLLTFDVVIDPADADAYPTVVRESLHESLDPQARNAPDADVDLQRKLEEVYREARAIGAVDEQVRLRNEFARQLAETVLAAREDERLRVEAAMGSVPGALMALERVKEALVPFILPQEYRRVVESVTEAKTLTEKRLAETARELKDIQAVARESTYRLYALQNVPASLHESLWSQIGPNLAEVSEEAFQVAVASLHSGPRAVQVEAKAQAAALAAYITEKTALHPSRTALRARLESMAPRTQADVDRIIASFTGTSGRSAVTQVSITKRVSALAEGRIGTQPPAEE